MTSQNWNKMHFQMILLYNNISIICFWQMNKSIRLNNGLLQKRLKIRLILYTKGQCFSSHAHRKWSLPSHRGHFTLRERLKTTRVTHWTTTNSSFTSSSITKTIWIPTLSECIYVMLRSRTFHEPNQIQPVPLRHSIHSSESVPLDGSFHWHGAWV